jgi:DNA-binding NarL/FixJ family response regulator
LCQQLIAAPAHPTIIILTSFYDEHEALLAKELGISLYLLKDIDSDALLKAIVTTHERHA